MNEENNCLSEQKEEIVYSYVVGVSFKKALQVYYFGTNDATLKKKKIRSIFYWSSKCFFGRLGLVL